MASTADSSLAVTALPAAPFGVEIHWRDRPAGAWTAAEAAELRELLARHHLLSFRDGMTEDAQIALARCFGRVLRQGPRVEVNGQRVIDYPVVTYVSNVREEGILGNQELAFHHDLAHVATPLAGITLYAEEVTEGMAITRYANGERAYDRLPDDLKARLEQLQVLFTGNFGPTGLSSIARTHKDQLDPTWPRGVHPLVVPHPVSGRRCLYFNQMQTVQILGMPVGESDQLLDVLSEYLYDPADIYEHVWQRDELLVWDNLVLQHARQPTDERVPRTLRRVVFGEKAVWEEWPYHAEPEPELVPAY
jgi:alpha-ketoglutarate-dependent taurine dioxygenase